MQGDQNKLTDLKKLLTITGPCEVILDDGSHVPSHQMKSFNFDLAKTIKELVPTTSFVKQSGSNYYFSFPSMYIRCLMQAMMKKEGVMINMVIKVIEVPEDFLEVL